MLKYYYEIIKPGIIFGNIILVIGSFLFASAHNQFNFFLFLYTLLGTGFVIASGCVFNNLIDYDLDQNMARTKNRALAKKLIKPINALIFGFFLGCLGVFILGFLVNLLSMFLSIFGFLVYVFLYTYFYKRKSFYSTFIGSFAGSTPSLIGYTAVSNKIDVCSILFFFILVFWQMSHFYAISIIRFNDYKNAKIPVFSVVNGIYLTKIHIFFYIFSFLIFNIMLTILGYLSIVFLILSLMINCYWLYLSACNIFLIDENNYSVKIFYTSIIVVFIFNILVSIDFVFLN